ncbi:MAG TPA: GIY-YIG nuclease family protein [Candidatus Paceibacterota bacterium]
MPFVYILRSEKGMYYTGSTSNLSERLRHHHGGYTPSTSRMGKLTLVFKQEYGSLILAREVEKKIKMMKRKDYIEKIIKDGVIKKK